MPAYIAITDPETDPEAPLTSELAKKWRDNPLAIAEGEVGAPRIQDAALDTGAATAAGITWVALRTIGLAVGAVGSYALLSNQSTLAQTITQGTTVAGSDLRYSAAAVTFGTTPSGTWRCMGRAQTASTGTIIPGAPERVTLWLRIS